MYIRTPDLQHRLQLMQHILASLPVVDRGVVAERMARVTAGYTCRLLQRVVRAAYFSARMHDEDGAWCARECGWMDGLID